jgi:hypothetical protein
MPASLVSARRQSQRQICQSVVSASRQFGSTHINAGGLRLRIIEKFSTRHLLAEADVTAIGTDATSCYFDVFTFSIFRSSCRGRKRVLPESQTARGQRARVDDGE